jgi:site-specific recombinase XerD
MIDLMMLHGLRNIEVHRLNIADYEPNARGEQGTLRVLGKGDKPRTIILRPEMQAELDLWLNLRAMFKLDDAQLALFISLHAGESWGTRLSQRSIRERVDVYLEAADLKREGVSCHALRHTYATLYVEAKGKDVNREVLAYSMGHGDSKITNAYIDWVDMAAENPSEPLMEILTTAAAEAAEVGAEKKRGQRKR